MTTILQLRNKCKNVKIQLGGGETFHAFSCVLDIDDVRESMREEPSWKFWPDSMVAVHKDSVGVLAQATKHDGVVLKWVWEHEQLQSSQVIADDHVDWDQVIVDVAQAVLSNTVSETM